MGGETAAAIRLPGIVMHISYRLNNLGSVARCPMLYQILLLTACYELLFLLPDIFLYFAVASQRRITGRVDAT